MDDNLFEIPVTYKGNEISYKAELLTYGYTYKIEVDIDGQKVTFEPDEEKNFRCLIYDTHTATNRPPDYELLQIIALTLKEILS